MLLLCFSLDVKPYTWLSFLSSQSLNAALFYNNPDARSYVSLVPTSAHTGDGMGDLISQVVQLTQLRLAQRLAFSEEMQSMVLEVRADSLRATRFLRKLFPVDR